MTACCNLTGIPRLGPVPPAVGGIFLSGAPQGRHGGQRQPPGTQVLIPVGDPSLYQVG